MTDPLRPPPGTAAATFFETWLPDAFARSGRSAAPDAPAVQVALSGPGGGEWRVHLDSDGLQVVSLSEPGPPRTGARGRREPLDPTVEVLLRQSAADFAASFTPDPDLPDLLPPGWSALDLLFLDPRDVAMARQMAGRILIEIEGRRRRRWALDAAFGKEGLAAGRPRATVQIDGTTYDGLRTGKLAPMQALLAGKVQLEGDRALAGRALMLTASRLVRG